MQRSKLPTLPNILWFAAFIVVATSWYFVILEHQQIAQEHRQISRQDRQIDYLWGVMEYRNEIGDLLRFREGDVLRGRVASFNMKGTLVQQSGNERAEYDVHSLLQHAANPRLMLKTIEQTQARGDLLELRVKNGRIVAGEIARPRSQGRSR